MGERGNTKEGEENAAAAASTIFGSVTTRWQLGKKGRGEGIAFLRRFYGLPE